MNRRQNESGYFNAGLGSADDDETSSPQTPYSPTPNSSAKFSSPSRRMTPFRSSQPPATPRAEPLAAQVFSRTNLGLITLLLSSPSSQHKRNPAVAQTVRLNMGKIYLKFIIQALLYLLTAYLFVSAITLCFKLSCTVLIPITILCALQQAARRMHAGRNRLHDENGSQNYSLTSDIKWTSNKFLGIIDGASNFALGLFSFIPERLAQTSVLNGQMSHITDYSTKASRNM